MEDDHTGPVDALGLKEITMPNGRQEFMCIITRRELISFGLSLEGGHVRHKGGACIVGHGFVREDGLLEVFVHADIYDALTYTRAN
jgi:hypothetical protein